MKYALAAALLLSCPSARAFGDPGANANIFVNLSKKLIPSVVNISTTMTVKESGHANGGRGTPEDMFRRFFEDFFRNRGAQDNRGHGEEDEEDLPPAPSPGGKGPRAMSLGTGFIIESGLILTNNHVVADADEIKINFTEEADEKASDGEVVGRDPELDLALIRVKSKREMTPVNFGDSDKLEVGEYVFAVGNPFGQGHSVTHGIISAKERDAPDFVLAKYLQTDAPINPGNSGGPLVNLKGEVIGINNAIDARAQGIGFAIPINLVKSVLPQLKTKGTVSRGYIGVLVNELTPEVAEKLQMPKDTRAPFVTHVYPGEPAEKAGLKPYDVILEIAGKPVHTSKELVAAVTSVPVDSSVPLKVSRAGKTVELSIKVAQRPGNKEAEPKKDKKKDDKKKKKPARLDIGAELEDMSAEVARELGLPDKTAGAIVNSTAYGGPADTAGLLRGDIIIEADRKPVKNADDFYAVVKEKKSYLLRVRRGDPQGREIFSVIILDLKKDSK